MSYKLTVRIRFNEMTINAVTYWPTKEAAEEHVAFWIRGIELSKDAKGLSVRSIDGELETRAWRDSPFVRWFVRKLDEWIPDDLWQERMSEAEKEAKGRKRDIFWC